MACNSITIFAIIMRLHFTKVVVFIVALILCFEGQNMKKNVRFGKRMLNALIDIVQGVSFIECTEECISRIRCLSVNYWRGELLCELNSVNTSSHSLTDDPRTVFSNILLWEQKFIGSCKGHQCAINMKCVPGPLGTQKCDISDSGPLPIFQNAREIKSKEQFPTIGIGSLRIFHCYPWPYEKKYRQKVICGSDGNWTHPQNTPCDMVSFATDLTSIETLHINSIEIEVPHVYSKGQKWAVIQRRCFNNTDFFRRWSDYKAGFGNFKKKSDFWIGNDVIHIMTKNGFNHLKFELLTTDNELVEAEYTQFLVGDESSQYSLKISGFEGIYDCMTNTVHQWTALNGMKFSTIDIDNDKWSGSCSNGLQAGWWFRECTCGNVNGLFGNEKTKSVMRWMCATGWNCPLKATRILIKS